MELFVLLLLAVFLLINYFSKIAKKKREEDSNVIFMEKEEKPRKKNFKFPTEKFWTIVVIIIIVLIVLSCFFTVDQTEYAFLSTFGKPSREILESGLRFKLPYPIQKVHKFSKETFSLQLGYSQDSKNPAYENIDEAKMITGDENIILADIEIQWRITDPIKYEYNLKEPKVVLKNATSSALRNTIGNSLVDDALTDGRTRIINEIREMLVRLINTYDMGVSIVNVNLQDVDLPTDEVDQAFKKVTDAREERSTKVNEANKYKNEKLNQVQGESEAILSRAKGDKEEIIEKARGDVASFNALYAEYAANPEITRNRLIIETMTKVYGTSKLVIVNENGTLTHIPLTELIPVTEGGN